MPAIMSLLRRYCLFPVVLQAGILCYSTLFPLRFYPIIISLSTLSPIIPIQGILSYLSYSPLSSPLLPSSPLSHHIQPIPLGPIITNPMQLLCHPPSRQSQCPPTGAARCMTAANDRGCFAPSAIHAPGGQLFHLGGRQVITSKLRERI